jgi:hypothetical protein
MKTCWLKGFLNEDDSGRKNDQVKLAAGKNSVLTAKFVRYDESE